MGMYTFLPRYGYMSNPFGMAWYSPATVWLASLARKRRISGEHLRPEFFVRKALGVVIRFVVSKSFLDQSHWNHGRLFRIEHVRDRQLGGGWAAPSRDILPSIATDLPPPLSKG